MKLSEKIEKLRTDNGLSQQDLAEKVFVSRQAVQKWEKGKSQPSIDVLKLLSKLFNVTVDYLITDDEPEVAESIEDKEPEKTEKTEEKPHEIPDKKKKHTGLKITLGILIPALVIGGGALAIKLNKDAKQKAYDTAYETSISSSDFDIKSQIIPDVNNVTIQMTPLYNMIDVSFTLSVSGNIILSHDETKNVGTVSAGQILTYEISYSSMKSHLQNLAPSSVHVHNVKGFKQNKYRNSGEEAKQTYPDVDFTCYYSKQTSLTSQNKITFKSNYDGLIFGGSNLKIVFKYKNTSLTISPVSFLTSGPHYLHKGETFDITGRFNLTFIGVTDNEYHTYTLDHIESGTIYYGPKKGNQVIKVDTNEMKEIIEDDFCHDYDNFYEVSFWSKLDVAGLKDVTLDLTNKTTGYQVSVHADEVEIINGNTGGPCFDIELSDEIIENISGDIDFRLRGDLITVYQTKGLSKINYMYEELGVEHVADYQVVIEGYPMTMPATKTFSNKQIYGYYEDKEFKKLVDFTKVVEYGNKKYYAKVK